MQCRRILKLTTTMVSPHNFSAVEPVHLVTLNLSPKDETGLVSLIMMFHILEVLLWQHHFSNSLTLSFSICRGFLFEKQDRETFSLVK